MHIVCTFKNQIHQTDSKNKFGNELCLLYVPNAIKKCMDLDTFKTLIMSWNGPRCQCNLYHVLS